MEQREERAEKKLATNSHEFTRIRIGVIRGKKQE